MRKKNKNIKFISVHKKCICSPCKGTGCKICKKTGLFKEKFYYLVYTNKKKEKLAFEVDSLK